MWKTIGLTFLILCAWVLADDPYREVDVDFARPDVSYTIDSFVGDTTDIRVNTWQGTGRWDATGWIGYLRWSENVGAIDGMVTLTGTVYGTYTIFTPQSNYFYKAFSETKPGFTAIFYAKPLTSQNSSIAHGNLVVRESPEKSAVGKVAKTFAINGSEYGPFTGDFGGWPFLVDSNYAGSWVDSSTFMVWTNAQTMTNQMFSDALTNRVLLPDYIVWTNAQTASNALFSMGLTNKVSLNDFVVWTNAQTQTNALFQTYFDNQDASNTSYGLRLTTNEGNIAIIFAFTSTWNTVTGKLATSTFTTFTNIQQGINDSLQTDLDAFGSSEDFLRTDGSKAAKRLLIGDTNNVGSQVLEASAGWTFGGFASWYQGKFKVDISQSGTAATNFEPLACALYKAGFYSSTNSGQSMTITLGGYSTIVTNFGNANTVYAPSLGTNAISISMTSGDAGYMWVSNFVLYPFTNGFLGVADTIAADEIRANLFYLGVTNINERFVSTVSVAGSTNENSAVITNGNLYLTINTNYSTGSGTASNWSRYPANTSLVNFADNNITNLGNITFANDASIQQAEYSGDGTNTFFINENGYLGLNTTNPLARLHLAAGYMIWPDGTTQTTASATGIGSPVDSRAVTNNINLGAFTISNGNFVGNGGGLTNLSLDTGIPVDGRAVTNNINLATYTISNGQFIGSGVGITGITANTYITNSVAVSNNLSFLDPAPVVGVEWLTKYTHSNTVYSLGWQARVGTLTFSLITAYKTNDWDLWTSVYSGLVADTTWTESNGVSLSFDADYKLGLQYISVSDATDFFFNVESSQ